MLEPIGAIRTMQREVARRRAQRTLHRLGGDFGTLRRRFGDVRSDVYSGFVVKEATRLVRSATRAMPTGGRRRRLSPSVAVAPAILLAGMAAVGGVLMWDERRRSAMRQRLEDVVGSVGSGLAAAGRATADKVTPPASPVKAGRD
ncbi:MAG TPA: hypothetical protein VGO86_12000 [Candidatus Dormibacteraeota bacterium]